MRQLVFGSLRWIGHIAMSTVPFFCGRMKRRRVRQFVFGTRAISLFLLGLHPPRSAFSFPPLSLPNRVQFIGGGISFLRATWLENWTEKRGTREISQAMKRLFRCFHSLFHNFFHLTMAAIVINADATTTSCLTAYLIEKTSV